MSPDRGRYDQSGGLNRNRMNANGKQSTIRIGTWNTEWAKPGSIRGKIIGDTLAASDCDVLCLTEGFAGILPDGGHVIDAGKDWGYPIHKGRRKVLLWSKHPWTPHTHALGSAGFPQGRFVAGSTETLSGACLTVVGVCIPWRGAHVKGGSKDRKPWQDHEAWLAGFEKLRYRIPSSKSVILGDFNQKIPRTWVPQRVHNALLQAFDAFEIATEGELAGAPDLSIDHIAHTPDLTRRSIGIWHRKGDGGEHLSDHFGVYGNFGLC